MKNLQELRLVLLWAQCHLRKSPFYLARALATDKIDSTLFGTPIAGELVKSGYLALSCFSGTTLIAGACLIAASRFYQDRRFTAKV